MASSAWRDLRQVHKDLKEDPSSRLLISVGLSRFSKKAAYWIDIYRSPGKIDGHRWAVGRQWSFTRSDKLVEDQTVDTLLPHHKAINLFNEYLQHKLDNGWKVSDVNYGNHNWEVIETELISQLQLNDLTTEHPPVVLSRANRLKELQNKRKTKSSW
jgi:hypothetical protein